MRKYIYIVIAFLLFIGTIGPSLNMHFCGGRFVSYAFFTKAKKCCESSCKCCKDYSLSYKIKGDFLKHILVLDGPEILKSDLIFTEIIHIFLSQNINVPVAVANPPPDLKHPVIYSIRVLRI